MFVLLDTDLVTLLQQPSQPSTDRLAARLDRHPPDQIGTTIISFQEEVQGWMAHIKRARTAEAVVRTYAKLHGMLRDFCRLKVLPFDDAAQNRFTALQRLRLRIGTMDLRIASIALAVGATLLSRNLRHFQQVPGLVVEDWAR